MNLTVSNFEDFNRQGGNAGVYNTGSGGGGGGGYGGGGGGGYSTAFVEGHYSGGGGGGGGYGDLTISGINESGAGKFQLAEDGLSSDIGNVDNGGAISLKFYIGSTYTLSAFDISTNSHSNIDQELTDLQDNVQTLEEKTLDIEPKTQYIEAEDEKTVVNSDLVVNGNVTIPELFSFHALTNPDQFEIIEIPERVTTVTCRAWGAGGSNSSNSDGGGGGFSETILNVQAGQKLYCYVGRSGYNENALVAGGGKGIADGGGGSVVALFDNDSYTLLAVAGGGGGAGFGIIDTIDGGVGGGLSGGNGEGSSLMGGRGGSGGTGGNRGNGDGVAIGTEKDGKDMLNTASNFEDFDGRGGSGFTFDQDYRGGGGGGGYGGGGGANYQGTEPLFNGGGGGLGDLTISGSASLGAGKDQLAEDGLDSNIGNAGFDGAITIKIHNDNYKLNAPDITTTNHSSIDQELTDLQDNVQNVEQSISNLRPALGKIKTYYKTYSIDSNEEISMNTEYINFTLFYEDSKLRLKYNVNNDYTTWWNSNYSSENTPVNEDADFVLESGMYHPMRSLNGDPPNENSTTITNLTGGNAYNFSGIFENSSAPFTSKEIVCAQEVTGINHFYTPFSVDNFRFCQSQFSFALNVYDVENRSSVGSAYDFYLLRISTFSSKNPLNINNPLVTVTMECIVSKSE